MRMKRQRLLYAIAFQKMAASQNFLQKVRRQVFALQQQTQQLFIKRRILQRGKQLVGRSFVNQPDELLAGYAAQFIVATQLAAPSLFRTSLSAMRAAVSAASTATAPITAFGNFACS